MSTGNKSFLVQFLRKRDFPANQYMATYINLMLRELMKKNSNQDVTISIWGGCWGRMMYGSSKSIQDLINAVFKGVRGSNLKIVLINGYKSYNFTGIKQELVNQNYNVFNGSSFSDHAKIFQVTISGDLKFKMIGSTNFSRQQYLLPDGYKGSPITDQADVVFLKYDKMTSNLFFPAMMSTDNEMVRDWFNRTETGNRGSNNSEWAEFNLGLKGKLKYFPYYGSESDFTEKFTILENSEKFKPNYEYHKNYRHY